MASVEERTTYLLLAVLMVPFGVAAYQDLSAPPKGNEMRRLAESLEDEAYYDSDYDSDFAADEASGGYEDETYDDSDEEEYEEEEYEEELNSEFFQALFLQNDVGPGLVGTLRDLTPGASEAHVSATFPNLESWEYEEIGELRRDYGVSVLVETQFAERTLTSVTLRIAGSGNATDLFGEHWGRPSRNTWDSDILEWYAPSRSLRLTYEYDSGESTITIERYQTFEELIAPKSKLFGFERGDVLSLRRRAVRALPEFNGWSAVRELPHVQGTRETEPLSIFIENDQVTRAYVELTLDEGHELRATRLLKKKLGAGEIDDTRGLQEYLFRQGERHIRWACDGGEIRHCQLSVARGWDS